MLAVVRWVGLGAAAFSLSLLLQRNFLLEPSAAFGTLIEVYRAITGVLLEWMEPVFEPLLAALGQQLGLGPLRLAIGSDPLIQDGFIVLAVFMATLSRGLASGRSGVVALTIWGTAVALATAVLRSSAGTLQPLPDEVTTEVSTAFWEFFKVQLVVLAPVVYLAGAAALSLLRVVAIAQSRLLPILAVTALAAVPLAGFSHTINATLLPPLGIDPFSSYLGVGAALVPVLFIATLAALIAALPLALAGMREGDAGEANDGERHAQVARDLAILVFAAAMLLAANLALRAAGL